MEEGCLGQVVPLHSTPGVVAELAARGHRQERLRSALRGMGVEEQGRECGLGSLERSNSFGDESKRCWPDEFVLLAGQWHGWKGKTAPRQRGGPSLAPPAASA